MARLRAVVVIHAPGLRGTPSRGQRSSATTQRVLHRLLGEVEVAEDADQRGDRPPDSCRNRRSTSASGR